MVSDAESHAEEDRRQRELAEARNNGENAAYQAERQLKELGEAVDSSSKEEIEAAIKDVRESLTSEDADEINAKTEALKAAFHKVSEAMYQRAQEQAATGAPTDGAASRRTARVPRRTSSTQKSLTRASNGAAYRSAVRAGEAPAPRPPRPPPTRPTRRAGPSLSVPPGSPRRRPTRPAAAPLRSGRTAGCRATSRASSSDDLDELAAKAAEGRRVPRPRAADQGRLRELPQARAPRGGRRAGARRGQARQASCCRRSTTSTGRSTARRTADRQRRRARVRDQARPRGRDRRARAGRHRAVLARGRAVRPAVSRGVAQQPVEGAEPGTVVEVYQRGYRLGDYVLRPARVVVAG